MKPLISVPILFIFFSLFTGCLKEPDNTGIDKTLIPASATFKLNYLDNVFFTHDNGLLISGVYNNKVTIIRTDYKFEIIWTKNIYEWGNLFAGSGWGASFYSVNIIQVFQKNDGTFVCFCQVMQGGDDVRTSLLIIELNKNGEQMHKVELPDNSTGKVLQANDGGYLLLSVMGTHLLKLDGNYNLLWQKNFIDPNYAHYQIISTSDGGYATTGSYKGDHVFLKKFDSNVNETSGYTYKHNDIPFEEAGFDLVQLPDKGFLIIGRTGKTFVPNVINCQVIRTNADGDTLSTIRFGNSVDSWLESFISVDQNELVIQGSEGHPGEDQKSILIKVNSQGQIMDSIRTEMFQMILYSPLRFYIKVKSLDPDYILFTTVESDRLFK